MIAASFNALGGLEQIDTGRGCDASVVGGCYGDGSPPNSVFQLKSRLMFSHHLSESSRDVTKADEGELEVHE